jgi:hypothetical protein
MGGRMSDCSTARSDSEAEAVEDAAVFGATLKSYGVSSTNTPMD